jgi:hypothetical protein
MEFIMFMKQTKSGNSIFCNSVVKVNLLLLAGLAGHIATVNPALAHSQSGPNSPTTFVAAAQAPLSTKSIVAMVPCAGDASEGCALGATLRETPLNQSELDWLFKFGGPH